MPRIVWTEGEASGSLDSFLAKNPPSKTYNSADGDGWIWVRSNRTREVEGGGSSKSLEEAKKALDGLVERYKDIDENPKIPKVKSKTSGPSKKMLRESAAKDMEKNLRDFGREWPCGKWLYFEKANYVDAVFAKLAKSVIDGPLSKLPNTKVHTIKVATADVMQNSTSASSSSSNNRGRKQQWLICVYFDVVWNEEHAKEVLECLVKEHGDIPNSVKADLYTSIGLDSHHPSKLRSTLYRPAEIFNDELLKEWQGEYRARMNRKAQGTEKDEGSSKKRATTNGHSVPIKPEDYWPASQGDDEDDFEEVSPTTKTPAKNEKKSNGTETSSKADDSKHNPIKKVESEDSDTEEEEEEISLAAPPPIKKATSSSPAKSAKVLESSSPSKDLCKSSRDTSPIKETILPVKALASTKRDRFGRSDF